MSTQALSRKEKRSRIAQAARIYGIKGEEALALHEAYQLLGQGELAGALRLAHSVSQSHPANPHPWIILGGAALNQREGATAAAFFGKAAESAPRSVVVLEGLAKAQVLNAEVIPACQTIARAVAAGSKDAALIKLYLELMGRIGRRFAAAKTVAPVVRRIGDASLALALGDLLVDAEEPGAAVEWLDLAWRLDPAPEAHRIAHLRSLLYAVRLPEAQALAQDLLPEVEDKDIVVLVLLTALRILRRLDEAEALAETHEFATPESFSQARSIVANIHQDRGDFARASAAYEEALHIATPEHTQIRKAYGVYRLRAREFAAGNALFAARFPAVQRKRCPEANAAPDALARRAQLYLISEQGIGDQLALACLTRIAPLPEGCRLTLVGDPRLASLLQGNRLGLGHLSMEEFLAREGGINPEEMAYIGDFARYLGDHPARARQGAYLTADPQRRAHLRRDYEARAQGRPIVGVAWASRSLVGALRSLPLVDLVRALPEGAFVVNLQYGDCRSEIAAARAARPDLLMHSDPAVDQMADLAGFAAQIAALDRVVTIDNTTAHLCGALGHPDASVLLPAGSECMWYWGLDAAGDEADDWYGSLALYRQRDAGDWSAPLAALAKRLGQADQRASGKSDSSR
ncbi:hypothetical protein [Brevirhabdus sp.]|uniref:hypothetical protein n=1 Tax=Brevirhabdus sp. TaxID=2004514 RepID=UPI004058A818